MNKCWAASLEGCAQGISREHYVSEAFFSSPAVRIHGLPWCKDAPKTIGIAAATSKILCGKHNSELSPLDEIGGKFMSVINEHLRLSSIRPKNPATPLQIERFDIDALLLERWLLKCMLNLIVEGPYLIGMNGQVPGEVPHELVLITYGKMSFEGNAGMYVGSYEGQNIHMDEQLQFAPLLLHSQRVIAGLFRVAGVQFYLALDPKNVPSSLGEASNIDLDWRATNLKRPFKKIIVKHGKFISHTIKFLWTDQR